VRDEIEVGCEAVEQHRCAVESYDGNFVFNVADEIVEHGAEVLILLETTGAGAPGLHDNDECERLVAGVLLEMERLLDTVVGEDEVFGLQSVDELARLRADECGDDD
jgi:hypothetical protein